MSYVQYTVITYLVLWSSARARGCYRRWRQPVLRGPEWFFDVHVQPGFYTGPGKKILDRYRRGILMTLAVELPIAVAIFISGHYVYLMALIIGMAIVIHVNHLVSVPLAERRARAFAVSEAEEPVPAMVLSLKTRRLSDYSNRTLDRVLALIFLAAIAWLVRFYFQPGHHNWRIFFTPALALYMEGAMLFAKRVILAWRTPVPQGQAEEYLAAREEKRRFYLNYCDFCRLLNGFQLASWPVLLSLSSSNFQLFISIYLGAFLVFGALAGVWGEIRRRKVLAVSLRTRPVKFPDLLESGPPAWPVCYEPSAPMMVLKAARGYSLNFANALAQFGALYFAAGLALFMVAWRMEY